jgi:hypothetical protein
MFNFLKRWVRRSFRGDVQSTVPHWDGGKLVQYDSGHVEYHGPKGEVIDVERDLFYQSAMPRDWQAYVYGGGAVVTLYNKTRDEAMQEVARNLGSVSFVDEAHGFIFYKPRGYVPVANLPGGVTG